MVEHTFFEAHFDILFATGVSLVVAAVAMMWRKQTQQEVNIKRLDHIEQTQKEIKESMVEMRKEAKEVHDKDEEDHDRLWSKTSGLDSRLSSMEAKIDILLDGMHGKKQ